MSFSWYILCCGNQREYFQRSTHNHSMLTGSSQLARLAGQPRLQWGRLVMRYAAPLYEERSESRLATVVPLSGDYRGQRFVPLLGVGGLIGAAVTEEEDQAKQSFNHGKISVDTARLRLLRPHSRHLCDAPGRHLPPLHHPGPLPLHGVAAPGLQVYVHH